MNQTCLFGQERRDSEILNLRENNGKPALCVETQITGTRTKFSQQLLKHLWS